MMKPNCSLVNRQFDFATLLHPVVVLLLGTPPTLLRLVVEAQSIIRQLRQIMPQGGIHYGRA